MAISTPSIRQNRKSILPLAALLCLGLILFVIGAIIVIALIPVYVSRRNEDQTQFVQTSVRQVIYPLPTNNTYATGSLTQTQLDYLVTQYQTTINNNPTTVGSTISSPGATITSSTAKKRKRQTTGITQFLTFTYQILFQQGITLRRQNEIISIVSKIIDVPVTNFDFLGVSNQTYQSYPAVLYVWSGQDPSVENAADFVAVVDFNENSSTYGQILKTVPLVSNATAGINQIRNEPHHAGISSDGRYYLTGGLLSFLSKQKEIFVWSIPTNPADGPQFLYALDAPGACPDEFLPIGDAKFLVSMMCNDAAVSPGDMAFIDAETRFTKSFLENASALEGFNPHGFGRLSNGSVFVADYINPLTLTSNDASKIVFRDTTRHFLPDGRLERTFQFQFPTEPGKTSGIGRGIGFMELKTIPNDPFGRSYACGTSDNSIHLMGPGMSEPILALDVSEINDHRKSASAGLLSFFPDGKRALMTFQMRYVILINTTQAEKPVILRAFDFCTDSSLAQLQIQVPDSNETTTFSQYCIVNHNITGAHVCYHSKGENRFVIVNYFLKFGLAQFAGTRSVHAFKLNEDLTDFVYDHRFNPNFQSQNSQTQQRSTFYSLKSFPHHAQYIRLH